MRAEQRETVFRVAKWEFNRFFKIRNVISGVLWVIGFGVIGGLAGYWVGSSSAYETIEIAITDYGRFDAENVTHESFHFIDERGSDAEALVPRVMEGEIHGILAIDSGKSARLWVHGEPGWTSGLRAYLDELRTDYMLSAHNVDKSLFEDISASLELEMMNTREQTVSTADKVLAGGAIGLVLMAVFLGFAYQFTAITGEKQQRITEQIVSAIEPQAWIDGKILGISAIGIAYMMVYGALGVLGSVLLWFISGAVFPSALPMINPMMLITFLLLAFLGILMWNSFLAAVAATIDDPNASERTGLMMFPLLPVFFAFFALVNADSTAITIMGLFPLTSYAVLPARMVLTEVAIWEPLLALVLLAATVWLFRRIAGRIFSTAMLIYGKEPGLREMYYWFKRGDASG